MNGEYTKSGLHRRTVVAAGAWTAPAIVLATGTPAFAANGSSVLGSITVLGSGGNRISGTGFVDLLLNPDPPAPPVPVATYDDPFTTTTGFNGSDESPGVYRLTFSNANPAGTPEQIQVMITIAGYGSVTVVVTLGTPGSLDLSFADPNLNAEALGVTVQGDGKALVAGTFTTAGASNASRRGVARFATDGTLDPTFGDPVLKNGTGGISAHKAVPLANGQILVCGDFTTVGPDDTPMSGLARLNADGTLDPTFTNPNITYSDGTRTVRDVVVQPDGKILAGGSFDAVGPDSITRRGVARFNADGSPDPTFTDPNITTNSGGFFSVHELALLSDGDVVVAGFFDKAGATNASRRNLAKFNNDGTLDTGFADPNLVAIARGLDIQPDGKIVVAGSFVGRVARFNADGTPDSTFTVADFNSFAWAVVVESGGSLLVGGEFTTVDGAPRDKLVRLSPDGSLDTAYADPDIGGSRVTDVALQSDGKAFVTGDFSQAQGQTRRRLARYNG
jgi:uncharacterized delta-60 repeat protein